MSLPISTTTVSILRGSSVTDEYADQDPYGEDYPDKTADAQVWRVIASNVRAVIGRPISSEHSPAGEHNSQSAIRLNFMTDPVDCLPSDRMLDEPSNVTYTVTWVMQRGEFGMTRTTGQLQVVTGL